MDLYNLSIYFYILRPGLFIWKILVHRLGKDPNLIFKKKKKNRQKKKELKLI